MYITNVRWMTWITKFPTQKHNLGSRDDVLTPEYSSWARLMRRLELLGKWILNWCLFSIQGFIMSLFSLIFIHLYFQILAIIFSSIGPHIFIYASYFFPFDTPPWRFTLVLAEEIMKVWKYIWLEWRSGLSCFYLLFNSTDGQCGRILIINAFYFH